MCCGIHLRAISLEMVKISIIDMSLKIVSFRLQPHLPRSSELTSIASDNGLSPGRRQAIIWMNAGILLIGPLGTNFSEILIEIQTFSLKQICVKMSFAKCRPFCLGLNELSYFHRCMSPLYWYKMVCMVDLSCVFIQIKSKKLCSMYLQHGAPIIFILPLNPYVSLFEYVKDALITICSKMGASDIFKALSAMEYMQDLFYWIFKKKSREIIVKIQKHSIKKMYFEMLFSSVSWLMSVANNNLFGNKPIKYIVTNSLIIVSQWHTSIIWA